jgi:general secretion pathway protein H
VKVKQQGGFSLLELLVALFVVVIITSLVTLSVNSGGEDIELDARVKSLADVSSYALDEAQLRGVDMGLLLERVDKSGERVFRYRFLERTPRGWLDPEIEVDIFAARTFPSTVELSLEMENTLVDLTGESQLAQPPSSEGKIAGPEPQVIFYSSGETTVGIISLRLAKTGELLWTIEWDLVGRFTLLRRGETSEP